MPEEPARLLAVKLPVMLESLQGALAPYFLYIKFVHVFAVMIWGWSTAVAYGWYVKGAFIRWEQNPEDPALVQRRNYAIEQFDKGAIMEHVAFPVVIVTGPLLWVISGWGPDTSWFLLKLLIVVFVFLPMELVDYHLAHFGGNKRRLRLRGASEQYERAIGQHWLFLKVTTPLVMVFIPLVVFLAIVKPSLW